MPTAPAPSTTPAVQSIHTDPIITKLLDKMPADMRESFSPDQLLALEVALYLVKSALGIDLRPGFFWGCGGGFRKRCCVELYERSDGKNCFLIHSYAGK